MVVINHLPKIESREIFYEIVNMLKGIFTGMWFSKFLGHDTSINGDEILTDLTLEEFHQKLRKSLPARLDDWFQQVAGGIKCTNMNKLYQILSQDGKPPTTESQLQRLRKYVDVHLNSVEGVYLSTCGWLPTSLYQQVRNSYLVYASDVEEAIEALELPFPRIVNRSNAWTGYKLAQFLNSLTFSTEWVSRPDQDYLRGDGLSSGLLIGVEQYLEITIDRNQIRSAHALYCRLWNQQVYGPLIAVVAHHIPIRAISELILRYLDLELI